MFYEKLLAESKHLSNQLLSIQAQLETLPAGKLICNKNGNYHKCYLRLDDKFQYLKNSERNLTEALAIKKYLTSLSEDLLHEKKNIDAYLKRHSSYSPKAPALFDDSSGYKELLRPYFQSNSDKVSDWLNTSYEHNLTHPEHLIHKTLSGNVVRSKSEALIDMALYLNKIPYRYECALPLGDFIFFPDFTILHPHTFEIIYWEHFGMMDDQAYSKNAYSKLQIYNTNGIIPSINLITTFETREHPLTSDTIENMIQHFLL